jgi:hypothetical protein
VSTDDDFEARDGDVLVVSYPEVKIPLATKYSTVTIGGLIYTRQLRSKDSPTEEYQRVYAFLRHMAEADARAKVQQWTEELAAKRPPPLPTAPKPVGEVVTSRLQPSAAAPGGVVRPKPVSR